MAAFSTVSLSKFKQVLEIASPFHTVSVPLSLLLHLISVVEASKNCQTTIFDSPFGFCSGKKQRNVKIDKVSQEFILFFNSVGATDVRFLAGRP